MGHKQQVSIFANRSVHINWNQIDSIFNLELVKGIVKNQIRMNLISKGRVLDSSYGSTQTPPPVAEKLMVVERSFARRLGSATALTEAVPPPQTRK